MSVELINAKKLNKLLPKLFEEHDVIELAVAWGSNNAVADELFKHSKKFRSVTFGLAFCQTDPDLVDRLVDLPNCFVAQSGTGTFHPKIYYFSTGDKAEAIIGSSNFTYGGLSKNIEANMHVKGAAKTGIFAQIIQTLDRLSNIKQPVTRELAEQYRLQYEVAKRSKTQTAPIFSVDSSKNKALKSQLINMSWSDYATHVQTGRYHNYSERLSILRECQRMIASVSSFSGLTQFEWKAIAGVLGEKQKLDAGLGQLDWGYFGSMGGMGDFANRIDEQDKNLAAALDGIPRHGDVNEGQYNRFCEKFIQAFEKTKRIGGCPTATRLLTMKRPDTFVCISKSNLTGLAKDLGFARSTLRLENYWERVIQPIRMSRWYNSSRPNDQDAELWDGRVAMLDAIYYEPK